MDSSCEVVVAHATNDKEISPNSKVSAINAEVLSPGTTTTSTTHEDSSSSNQSSDSDNLELSCHQVSPDVDSCHSRQATEEGQNAFVPPDKELVSKINGQIEQYFSDENILKDPFLLKHVRRNKEGYVSLKLIASFRKVKSLTKDWRVVAHSLKQSPKLEVNEEETKVRRKEPLPEHDETTVSRTVVAYNLPFDKPTVENVGEVFSKCGEISLIRILRPGASIPPEIKRLSNKHPEIGSEVCALVEFETHESALKAAKLSDSNGDHPRVVPIGQKVPKKDAQTPKTPQSPKSEKSSESSKKKKRGKKQDRLEEIRGEESESPFVSSCSETENSPKPRKRSSGSIGSCYMAQHRIECNGYRRGSFGNIKSPANSPVINRKCYSNSSYRPKSYSYCEGDLMASLSASSSWLQKRLVTSNGHINNCINSRLLIPEGVIRLPKGPDGTRGFNWNRGHSYSVTSY